MRRQRAFQQSAGNLIWSIIRGVIVLGICYVILYPLIIKFSSSLMREIDMFDQSVQFIPRILFLENYITAWEHMRLPGTFFNSIRLTLVVSVLQLFACTFIGYGFARFKFWGRELLFGAVIFSLVVPPQMIMIPLYMNFRYFTFFGLLPEPGLNLLGGYWPFVLTAITGTGLKNGLFIYIMRQFFKGMPKDLEEAAYIDGAGAIRTFLTVMLPNARPALLTVFLFAFVWQWNDYFFTAIYMGSGDILPVALNGLAYSVMQEADYISSHYRSIVNNTGMLMFIAPLLLIYTALQRLFVESVERTGIVG